MFDGLEPIQTIRKMRDTLGGLCFPCHPQTKAPRTNGISWKVFEASEHSELFRDNLIGVGIPKGFMAFDIDPRCTNELRRARARCVFSLLMGDLLRNPGMGEPFGWYQTPAGGYHLWVEISSDYTPPQTQGLESGIEGVTLDIRTAGKGYVIIPPSRSYRYQL